VSGGWIWARILMRDEQRGQRRASRASTRRSNSAQETKRPPGSGDRAPGGRSPRGLGPGSGVGGDGVGAQSAAGLPSSVGGSGTIHGRSGEAGARTP
jgi:hypothetical protein